MLKYTWHIYRLFLSRSKMSKKKDNILYNVCYIILHDIIVDNMLFKYTVKIIQLVWNECNVAHLWLCNYAQLWLFINI